MQTWIEFLKESIFFHVQGLYSWAFSVINTDFSKYINDVLHVPIQMNAIYSSVPRIASVFVSIFTGFISDWMHEKRDVSLTTIRKTFAALCNNLLVFEKKINWIFNIICGFFSIGDSIDICNGGFLCWLWWSVGGDTFNDIDCRTGLQCRRYNIKYVRPGTKLHWTAHWSCQQCIHIGFNARTNNRRLFNTTCKSKKKFCIWKFWFFTYINRK